MKEKYEKPIIDSEEFSLEMMAGTCAANEDTIRDPGYTPWGTWPPCQGGCALTETTLS